MVCSSVEVVVQSGNTRQSCFTSRNVNLSLDHVSKYMLSTGSYQIWCLVGKQNVNITFWTQYESPTMKRFALHQNL